MLDIRGYDGEPVPNTFMTSGESRHLAILFPGLSYACMMPVLFYPWKLLLAMGADLLMVEYDYARPDRAGESRETMAARLTADVSAAAAAGLAAGSYERTTLVGKSLGTLAMAHLLGAEPRLPSADCVWLTPLLRDERLRARITGVRPRSLFAIGTADAEYNPAVLGELRDATGGELLIFEGADHGLGVAGDVMTSIEYLAELVRRIAAFTDGGGGEHVNETGK
jgi:hypothetical protein